MTDYDKLRALAEGATTGPWERDADAVREVAGGCPVCFVTPHGNFNTVRRTGQTYRHADASYIAAASPDVVLSLLDERAALTAEVADYEASFALYDKAQAVLRDAYLRAHPDFPANTWPGAGKVAAWAAEQIAEVAALKAKVGALRQAMGEAIVVHPRYRLGVLRAALTETAEVPR